MNGFIRALETPWIGNSLWLFASEADFENPHVFCHGVDIAGVFVFINNMPLKNDCLSNWRRIRRWLKWCLYLLSW